jgi:hypothetical protein
MLASVVAGLLLLISLLELIRRPDFDSAMFGGLVPVTTHKLPWALVILAVLLALWLGLRRLGGARGIFWAAAVWVSRLGIWWSIAGLMLYLGVAVYGGLTRGLDGLNWPFALGFPVLLLALLLGFSLAWRRIAGR